MTEITNIHAGQGREESALDRFKKERESELSMIDFLMKEINQKDESINRRRSRIADLDEAIAAMERGG